MKYEPMDDSDLKILKTLCQAAPDGPWVISTMKLDGKLTCIIHLGIFTIQINEFKIQDDTDDRPFLEEISPSEFYDACVLICESRTLLPELLNKIEHLRVENEGLRQLNTAMKTASTQRASKRGCRP